MTTEQIFAEKIPLFISRSNISTELNKTGSWRYVRPIYDEKTAPCSAACPAGEDIARIEMLSSRGRYREALEIILLENPFPAVCGRVCFHTCETACNRSGLDEPIAIHGIERFIGDTAIRDNLPFPLEKRSDNGKKICIVGAGPSGLAAAYFLTRLGYSCHVFEAEAEPGGILRWGIPRYRLPDAVVNAEVQRIKNLGVKIICNTRATQNFLEEAKARYHAFFIGCGHGRSLKMNIPGESMALDGLDFLYRMRKGNIESLNIETAAVIGGGNTAIDVARSLVRLGVKAKLVYRRRKQDMPAFEWEVETAEKEGVKIMELFSPSSIVQNDGEYILTLQPMKHSGMETETGRARVFPDGETTQEIRAQRIFTAIGTEALESWQLPPEEIAETVHLDHCVFMPKNPPFLFGGDLTNRKKSVADAIASGKQSAMALDTFFKKGVNAISDRLNSCLVGKGSALSMERYLDGKRSYRNSYLVSYEDINVDYFSPAPRIIAESHSLDKQMNPFDEIEKTFIIRQVMEETTRCFNCGICNACDNCRIFCPEIAVDLRDDQRRINLDYCKGCGICVVECPRNAMALEAEV